MTVLNVLNTIFAGLGALAGLAGAVIAFVALRISMQSREKADAAGRTAAAAAEGDSRTRAAVADALDAIVQRPARDPSIAAASHDIDGPLRAIAERLRRGE